MKDEYQLARDVLRKSIENNNSIHDIWEFGSYKNPGLSDMDLMIIIDDEVDKKTVKVDIDKIINHKSVSKAMAHANPIVLPFSNSKDIFLWDDLSVFSLRDNSKIIDTITDKLKLSHRDNAMVVDFIFERIYRVNQYKKDLKNLSDFRKILGVCKSLRYSFHRLKRLSTLEKNTLSILKKFSLALDDARSSYVKKISLRKIKTQNVIKLACEAGAEVKKEIYKKNLPVFKKIKQINNFNCEFIFPDGMIYNYNKVLDTNSIDYVNVPTNFLFQILTYSTAEGSLSSLLKSSFKFDNELRLKDIQLWHSSLIEKNIDINSYYKYLLSRIEAANKWFDFLVERKLPYGLFKFGWYLPK